MQLLKETFPRVSRAAVLWEPSGSAAMVRASEAAARALSIHLQALRAGRPDELANAFAEAQQERADALFVLPGFFYAQRARLLELAAKYRLPMMYDQKDYVVSFGGLMSYGANFHDLFRRAAGYVDKILKGARPADLPVEQPTTYELASPTSGPSYWQIFSYAKRMSDRSALLGPHPTVEACRSVRNEIESQYADRLLVCEFVTP